MPFLLGENQRQIQIEHLFLEITMFWGRKIAKPRQILSENLFYHLKKFGCGCMPPSPFKNPRYATGYRVPYFKNHHSLLQNLKIISNVNYPVMQNFKLNFVKTKNLLFVNKC